MRAQTRTLARTPVRAAIELPFLQARIAHCALLITLCSTVAEIRDTLNNLILNSPQTWQTSVGLPYFQIQGTVVEWDE